MEVYYSATYVIVNLFGVYVIYKFMLCFFAEKRTALHIEIFSYLVYYGALLFLYFFLNIPLAFLVVNLVGFFLITFNYRGSVGRRITAVLTIYFTMFLVEYIVGYAIMKTSFPLLAENLYQSSLGVIAIKILSYVVVLFIRIFENMKKDICLPAIYCACAVLLPLGSLYILLLLTATELPQNYILLALVFLLLINISIFYLHDSLNASHEEKFKNAMLRQENKYYLFQFETLQAANANAAAFRHDIGNQLMAVRTIMNQLPKEEGLLHLEEMEQALKAIDADSNTGNPVIDSILNFKCREARQKQIEITVNAMLPKELKIDTYHLVCILGNLLDNAIEAAEKAIKPRVHIELKYMGKQLFIKIKNSHYGKISFKNGRLETTKQNRENHGIGLKNVNEAVAKLGGNIELDFDETFFIALVVLPI